jgi:hypothetical protein
MRFHYIRYCYFVRGMGLLADVDAQHIRKWSQCMIAFCSHPTHTDTDSAKSMKTLKLMQEELTIMDW